jgi:hypothetical protein
MMFKQHSDEGGLHDLDA